VAGWQGTKRDLRGKWGKITNGQQDPIHFGDFRHDPGAHVCGAPGCKNDFSGVVQDEAGNASDRARGRETEREGVEYGNTSYR